MWLIRGYGWLWWINVDYQAEFLSRSCCVVPYFAAVGPESLAENVTPDTKLVHWGSERLPKRFPMRYCIQVTSSCLGLKNLTKMKVEQTDQVGTSRNCATGCATGESDPWWC